MKLIKDLAYRSLPFGEEEDGWGLTNSEQGAQVSDTTEAEENF
jgi:hypothetical protein